MATLRDWMNEFTRKHGICTDDSGAVAIAPKGQEELEAEYQRLGGDRALLKVLAVEDHAFLARLEKQRIQARTAHQKLLDSLDSQRHLLEMGLSSNDASAPLIRAWWSREMQTYQPLADRVKSQGPKLDSEEGRQLTMLLKEREQNLDYYHGLAAHYDRWVEQARPNYELVQKRIADATETYEAIEDKLRRASTELDNMLELDAMPLEERIRRLQGSGTDDARTKAWRALESELFDFAKGSAEGLADKVAYFDDRWEFEPDAIDWKPLEKQLAKVECTDLEQLQKYDRQQEKLWNKYNDAGGDDALLTKRVQAWRKKRVQTEQRSHRMSMEFRSDVARLQSDLADEQLALRETQKQLATIAADQRAKKARARQLTAGAEEGELLSGREAAELKLLARDLKRLDQDSATRQELMRVHEDSIKNIKQRMERARDLYEHEIDDDEQIRLGREPRSEDLRDLPLRAKYDELTKKES